ncbi:MAG: YtxH domain-containing protein [Pyrinomonadaceae bacterium]
MEHEEYRREGSSAAEKLTYLLIGGGIGAIVALMFAPKSGVELREDIADATRKGVEKGRDAAVQVGARAGEYYEVARDKAGEYYDVTRTRASELYQTAEEKARQLAEQAREVTTAPRNNLSAAIEAGKQAYHEEKRKTEAASIPEGRPSYPNELSEGIKDF